MQFGIVGSSQPNELAVRGSKRMNEPTQEEQRLHDLLVMAQRGRDNEDITVFCTNCAEANDTDNDMCRNCRTLPKYQVKEWLSESIIDSQGMIQIANMTYEPLRVLKAIDPIAYNEMFLEFCDSLARDGYIVEGYNDNE